MDYCNICSNKLQKIIINKMEFNYCKSCEALYKTNTPPPLEEKRRYMHHVIDDGYKKYMENIFLKIKDFLNPGLSLDFGCGQKNTMEEIAKNYNIKMYSYDLYFYPFSYKNYKYDNIILNEVFEHIKKPLDLIFELKELLNDGGKIIILTKTHDNNFNDWWYLRDITHVSFFSKKTLSVIADVTNGEIVYNDFNLVVYSFSKND